MVSSHKFVSANSVPSPNFTHREVGTADKLLVFGEVTFPQPRFLWTNPVAAAHSGFCGSYTLPICLLLRMCENVRSVSSHVPLVSRPPPLSCEH